MFCLAFTLLYTTISGLWAVLWTDLVQFVLKMGMVIVLAVFAVRAVGGIDMLKLRLAAHDAAIGTSTLAFVPDWMSGFFLTFLVYLSVNWWASWYPGAEPGGGGYIAQRIFSAKNERHSLAATLWFNIANYALRPWPWILTALVAVVLIPHPTDVEGAYVQVMVDHLPASLRGLMLAGFAAAYMSTIGTQINLGASYLLNDVYRRFLVGDKSERHYVNASRLITVLVAVIAAIATYFMGSIQGAWKFLISIGAGAGLVFILRWFWWRINAWSEVSAMVAGGNDRLHHRGVDCGHAAPPAGAGEQVARVLRAGAPAECRLAPLRNWARQIGAKPALVNRGLAGWLRHDLLLAVRHRKHYSGLRHARHWAAGDRRGMRVVHFLGPESAGLGNV